jgi:flavin-dependent dehydrogenase
MEQVEYLVIGAGPAGLRAAQVLAEAGREVLVCEKNAEVGPKTCAGALSMKSVSELEALGLPPEAGRTFMAQASFRGEPPTPLENRHAVVRTVSRRVLGRFQADWARAAGAEIRTAAPVSKLEVESHTATVSGRAIRYRHIIGADGSASMVRRSLRLPSPRQYFAGEFNIPGLRLEHLSVALDSTALGNGYFWIFPHRDYTSVGAGGPTRLVPPPAIRPYIERRLRDAGIDPGNTPFEAATIEVRFAGFHFSNDVHLAGDAAGVASGISGEGIYAALVTGEEVARRLLDPNYICRKTRSWMRVKRLHDMLGRAWLYRPLREISLSLLSVLCRAPGTRAPVTGFFLG